MAKVDWEKKYHELLEKHNDHIDELMLATGLDCPTLIVCVKFYGPWDKNTIESFMDLMQNKIGLSSTHVKYLYISIGADTKHDITIDMYPIRKFLTGEIDCDVDKLKELLDVEKVEYIKSHIPF